MQTCLILGFLGSLISASSISPPVSVNIKRTFDSKPLPSAVPIASDTRLDEEPFTPMGSPYRQSTNGSTPAGWIQLGTPKKWLFTIFDTGSDKLVAKTWETVAAELASVDQGISGMVLPSKMIYDHNSSSTYIRTQILNPLTGKNEGKQSSITYGSGTALCDLGTDAVFVGNRTLANLTLMEITADSLQLLHTSKGIAGVLGLQHMKNKSLGNSLFSRMRDADLLDSFGYCRGTGNNGTFIWGDTATEGNELEVIGQMHWAVKLGSVKVADGSSANSTNKSLLMKLQEADAPSSLLSKVRARKQMQWPFNDNDGGSDAGGADDGTSDGSDSGMADPFKEIEKIIGKTIDDDSASDADFQDVANAMGAKDDLVVLKESCPDDKCTAILDTGSNIIAGPTDVIHSITNLVNVKSDCSNFDKLPNIEMKMGGMAVTVPPTGYVMKVPMPSWGGAMGGAGGEAMGDQEGEADGGAGGGDLQDGMEDQNALQEGSSPEDVNVVIQVEPGYVRRHLPSLSEQKASSRRALTNRRWKAVFDRLNRNYGIDLRDQINQLLKQRGNDTAAEEFLCMPALVPLDKKTQLGPLWVVGTPLLDAYYARWSFDKKSDSPRIHLKALQDAEVCKSDKDAHVSDSTPGLLRTQNKEAGAKASRTHNRGPTERLPEEIAYPHWAKDLLHV